MIKEISKTIITAGAIIILIIMISAVGHGVSAQTGNSQSEFHQTYPLTADGAVSLNNPVGSIHIKTWNENRVQVDAVKKGGRDEDHSRVEIRVNAQPERIDIRTVYPRERRNRVSVEYRLTVPTGARLESILSASGNINIIGPISRVVGTTASGNFQVGDVNERASITTASGNIAAERINGELTARTASGDITVSAVASTLQAHAASGSIIVRDVRDDANLSTVSGKIDVTNAGGRVNARSINGTVYIVNAGGDVQAESLSDNVVISNVKGRVIATGLSGSIRLTGIEEGVRAKTVSGRVEVSNAKGRIEITSTSDSLILNDIQSKDIIVKTTSGEIRFNGALSDDGRYEFESFSGNIILYLPAGSNFKLTGRSRRERLNSDFSLQIDQLSASSRQDYFTGVVGNGGADLRVATFSGNIYLKRQ